MSENKIKKSDATRQQIFEAALELIGKYGIDNVTLSDIAKKAGFSKGLFYYYFSNKEEILAYTFKKGEDIYAQAFEAASREESFEDSLITFYKTTYESYQKYGKEFIRSSLVNSLNTSESRFTHDDTMIMYLKPIFNKGIEQGVLKNEEFSKFVHNLMSFLLGTELIWCVNVEDRELSDFMVEQFNIFLHGITK